MPEMSDQQFEGELSAFKEDISKEYGRHFPDGAHFRVAEYETAKGKVIPSVLRRHPQLSRYYNDWLALLSQHGHKALVMKGRKTKYRRGHRVWAAMGQRGRVYRGRAFDATKKHSVAPEPLKDGVNHRPLVARWTIADMAHDGAFIPDPAILETFSRIAKANWEDAILALEGYDFESVEHGIILVEIKPDENEETKHELLQELDALKERIREALENDA